MNKVCTLIVIGLAALQCTANGQENRLTGLAGADHVFNRSKSYRYESYYGSGPTKKSVSCSVVIDAGGLLLLSPDMEELKASHNYSVGEDESASGTSYGLSLNVGLGLNTEYTYSRLMLTRAALLNDDIDISYSELSIETHFKVGQMVKIGLLAGAMHFDDTEWNEQIDGFFGYSKLTPDTEFEGGTGFQYGLILTIGNERIRFVCSISHVEFAYDVIDARNDPSKEWTASDDTLDISGTMLHLGVRVEF